MKAKLQTLSLIALVGAVGTTPALAHEEYSEASMFHNLSHVTEAQGMVGKPAVKGMEGRPGAKVFVPAVDYGEGTSLLTINQFMPLAGPSAASRSGSGEHGEYDEGTTTFHSGHVGKH